MFEFIEKLCSMVFILCFMACDKNRLFLILYEKYRMSSSTTCLIRNSNIPLFLAMDVIDLLGLLPIMACISATNLRVILVFSNLLHCLQIGTKKLKSSYWIFSWMPSSAEYCFQISGKVNYVIVPLSSGLVWFLLFNGISTFVGYLMPNPSF